MYHCQLNFILVGMQDEPAAIIKGWKPLERFSHEVEIYNCLEDVPKGAKYPGETIVFLDDDMSWRPAQLREKFEEKARIILFTRHVEEMSAKMLDLFEAVWPLPLTEVLLRYEMTHFLASIKKEKDAALTQQYLDTLIDMLPDLIWFKDLPGCHLKVNTAFCEAVGKSRASVTGKYHSEIWGTLDDELEHGEAVCLDSEEIVAKARRTCYFEEEVRHSKRGICQLKVFKTPVYGEDDEVIGTIGVARDVTKEMEDHAKILHLARTDALTGLANRRYFYKYVEENRANQGMAVCFIDLDRFKQLNDTYGHQSGDAALLGVAELLRRTFPKDFITRLGGDEFVVAILGAVTVNDVKDRLDALTEAAREFFLMDECLRGLSMSIGVAISEDEDTSLELLLKRSDEALYYSKTHGKGRYTFYDDMH